MKKLIYFFIILVVACFITCCANKTFINDSIVVKPEAYNTTNLLFYSNHDKKVVKKVINIPKEIPMNFTETFSYSEVFPWSKYICEIRFSEGPRSLPFYSIFAFYNYSKILAIAKVDSVDTTKRLKERSMFWVYDKNGNRVRATIKEFEKSLDII